MKKVWSIQLTPSFSPGGFSTACILCFFLHSAESLGFHMPLVLQAKACTPNYQFPAEHEASCLQEEHTVSKGNASFPFLITFMNGKKKQKKHEMSSNKIHPPQKCPLIGVFAEGSVWRGRRSQLKLRVLAHPSLLFRSIFLLDKYNKGLEAGGQRQDGINSVSAQFFFTGG